MQNAECKALAKCIVKPFVYDGSGLMRTDEKDIQTQICTILTQNGFSVIASEAQEGFARPACFVNVYPTSVSLLNEYMEQVSDTVEITYIPEIETVAHCAEIAQRMKNIFLYKPFDVKNRHLTIQEMKFSIENQVLYISFNLEYMQETPDTEEYEKISELQIGGL